MKSRVSTLIVLVLVVSSIPFLAACGSKRSEFEIKRDEKREIIRRQEEEMEKQERERRELERQKFWNNELVLRFKSDHYNEYWITR